MVIVDKKYVVQKVDGMNENAWCCGFGKLCIWLVIFVALFNDSSKSLVLFIENKTYLDPSLYLCDDVAPICKIC